MTTKEQMSVIAANQKGQKDAADNEFRRNARRDALLTAQHIEKGMEAEMVLRSADKIYQWLIKVLK